MFRVEGQRLYGRLCDRRGGPQTLTDDGDLTDNLAGPESGYLLLVAGDRDVTLEKVIRVIGGRFLPDQRPVCRHVDQPAGACDFGGVALVQRRQLNESLDDLRVGLAKCHKGSFRERVTASYRAHHSGPITAGQDSEILALQSRDV